MMLGIWEMVKGLSFQTLEVVFQHTWKLISMELLEL